MRVCQILLVVLGLSTITEFVLAQDSHDSDSILRDKQEAIACELARNDTFAEIFKSSIRQRHGVDPDFGEYDVVCRAFTHVYYSLVIIICY